MGNRSSLLVLGGALAGCALVAICVAVAVGGYLLYFNRSALPLGATPAAVNQIAYVGNDLNIYLADPATSATTALTRDGGKGHAYNYPTWSPDNRRLAYVGYTLADGTATDGALYTVTPSGDKLTPVYHVPDALPFYLYWSPDSQFIGFLANKDSDGIALRMAHTDQPDSMQELGSGSPLYWAWAPDGARVFAHIGGTRANNEDARLSVVEVKDANATALDTPPGAFQAPQWTRANKILFSTQNGTAQAIAISDAQGTTVKNLVPYQGRASFALSPDSALVAYLITDESVRLPHFGPLRLISSAGGESTLVSEEPVLAFLWSPDGTKLAYLTVSVGENESNFDFDALPPQLASARPETLTRGAQTDQTTTVQLHWHVWDTAAKTAHAVASFVPTTSFLNILPYFDQYASSSTFWSPDSQSLVYTVGASDITGEVWVASIDGKTPARKIGDGVLAFWSWK